jgi:transcriptional regulator with XRE-family HTH domain
MEYLSAGIPIGKSIEALRIARLKTRTEIAFRCGVSVTYISMVEKGSCKPTERMISSIYNAIGV